MAIVIAHGGLPPKFTLGAVFSQWSFDPKNAPTAEQLTEGLRQVIAGAARS